MTEHDWTCRPQSQRPVGDKSPICWDWSSEPKTTSPLDSWAMTVPTHRTMFPGRRAGTIASSMLRRTFAGHRPGNSRETSSNPLSRLMGRSWRGKEDDKQCWNGARRAKIRGEGQTADDGGPTVDQNGKRGTVISVKRKR